MNTKPSLYFLIPLYNEAPNIPFLFQSCQQLVITFNDKYRLKFVAIDDGSTDDTVKAIEHFSHEFHLDVVVLSHSHNSGPGRAFQTGFQYIAPLLSDNDWVITLEGDNTSRVELLQQMFHRSEEGYEVIFASPYTYGGKIINTSLVKVFLSSIANTFVKEFLGVQGIHTVSSFFRLYRASAIKKLQSYYGERIIEKDGFECMLEMLMKMINLNISISEVPMVLDTKKRLGKSKMKIIKTIFAYFTLWVEKKKWQEMVIAPPKDLLEHRKCAEDLP